MNTGEYIFQNVDHIEINRPFIDRLYASALYYVKDKYILEILAPIDSVINRTPIEPGEYAELDESKYNVGDRWEEEFKRNEMRKTPWVLDFARYYLEINGIKIGESGRLTTCFRYEPKDKNKELQAKNVHEDTSENNSKEEGKNSDLLLPIINNEERSATSVKDDINSIFEDEDFKETMTSLLSSLHANDLENDNYEEINRKFFEDREQKERKFFNKFRRTVYIPDYLKDETLVVIDLIFREDESKLEDNNIEEMRFILKSQYKTYLARINLKLPIGEYQKGVKIECEHLERFTSKLFIEGVVEGRREEKQAIEQVAENMPNGKKAIYVVYETIDNVEIEPQFYRTELLKSYKDISPMFTSAVLLNAKGINGFNKFLTFAGYVDENIEIADVELFYLLVNHEHNKVVILK